MKTLTPQEQQNRIYRKMSASKKLKIVDDFYKYSLKLQQTNDHPKIRKSNRLRLKSA